ncbi:ADP-ribose pyrophosphatase, mitochondrial [Platichthys flesus]|uniref:ADP-ribose pyrophosphatase, mitochondrial n=1 Tax=Platichthys flesus TaxID=8260 RepID=UPI002DB60583|nr:ADP-ribose pyrophosphatase, mitochondrial [Platichthys flesus]
MLWLIDAWVLSEGMIHFLPQRNWMCRIRLALTLLGLPCTVASSGRRSAIACSSFPPLTSSPTARSITSSSCNLFLTSVLKMPTSAVPHAKSRCPQYPGSNIKRFPVPDNQVDWSQNWPEYKPVSHTDSAVAKKPAWADPEIGSFSPIFNTVDGSVDRTSFEGSYKVENGKPLNPRGRTGLTDRGLLGRWGPNHAADPVVTRWKVDANGAKIQHPVTKRPILQFVSIKRKDCGQWAIPGGMVDAGEQVTLTLQREFSEEALNSLSLSPSERAKINEHITTLFKSTGFQVYKGYVDDPRNTDNAWMETVVVNFHDDSGDSVSELPLHAGDDAGQVKWADVDSFSSLYASHSHFLELVAKERKSHW